jgi:hypothetical protein
MIAILMSNNRAIFVNMAKLNTLIISSADAEEAFVRLVKFLLADLLIFVAIETLHNLTGLLGTDVCISAHLFECGVDKLMKLLDPQLALTVLIESSEGVLYHLA